MPVMRATFLPHPSSPARAMPDRRGKGAGAARGRRSPAHGLWLPAGATSSPASPPPFRGSRPAPPRPARRCSPARRAPVHGGGKERGSSSRGSAPRCPPPPTLASPRPARPRSQSAASSASLKGPSGGGAGFLTACRAYGGGSRHSAPCGVEERCPPR